MRESTKPRNGYEEVISLCSDYEREIDEELPLNLGIKSVNSSVKTDMLQQRHQFGAISFYTSNSGTPVLVNSQLSPNVNVAHHQNR